jgi:hypothetical protein
MEQAGRKQVFHTILPLLSLGLIREAQENRPMTTFCDRVTRQEHHRAHLWLKLRAPDSRGKWAWGAWSEEIPLPEPVFGYLWQGGKLQAPTLREIARSDGSRLAVLEKPEGDEPYRQLSRPVFPDTGGLDGRQARLRREIDRLKACKERSDKLVKRALQAEIEQHLPLPVHFPGWREKSRSYEQRIKTCWKTYERRNRELAHLASNLLILLALLYDCQLICGENLTTLKTEGRGRGVRGRWRNWRNNTTVRGELWRVLKYQCHLLGILFIEVS